MKPKPPVPAVANVTVGLVTVPLVVPNVETFEAIIALVGEAKSLSALRNAFVQFSDSPDGEPSTIGDVIVNVLQELAQSGFAGKLNRIIIQLLSRRRTYLTFCKVLNAADPDFAVTDAELKAADTFDPDELGGHDMWIGNSIMSAYFRENITPEQAVAVLKATWDLVDFSSIMGKSQGGESNPDDSQPTLPLGDGPPSPKNQLEN